MRLPIPTDGYGMLARECAEHEEPASQAYSKSNLERESWASNRSHTVPTVGAEHPRRTS